MSGKGQMHIDVKRPRPPKMSLKQTPSTPSAAGSSFGSNSTPTPVITPVKSELPISIELEKLHIGDETYGCNNEDLEDRGSIGEGHFGVVTKMYHSKSKQIIAVKKIPMKDLHMSGGNILELDVIKKAKQCPYIVHFYGCLLREVITG